MNDYQSAGMLTLIVAGMSGLAADHAGWNPWLWAMVGWFLSFVAVATLMGVMDALEGKDAPGLSQPDPADPGEDRVG